jgi:hypothetical protein
MVGGALFEFDRSEITEVLSAKPPLLSVAFALACARRLVNSLDRTGDGEAAALIAMRFWEEIRQSAVKEGSLPFGLQDQIIGLIPDEDDEPDLAAGVWDDALAALSFAAEALSGSSVEYSCNAASRAVDTAFRYAAQTLNDMELTDSSFRRIMEGVVVQTELTRQHRDLDEIYAGDLDEVIIALLDRAAKEALLPNLICYKEKPS